MSQVQVGPLTPPAADSTEALVDTLQADTTAQADTSAIGQLNEAIEETGRALAAGRFDVVYEQLSGILISFVLENLVPALLVGVLFWVIYKAITGLLDQALKRSKRLDAGVRSLLVKSARLLLGVFGVIMVLSQLGINVTAAVAGLGIAGLALGFAARDTMENLIAGVTVLLDQPFRVGDNIEVDGIFGTVTEITLRSTRLRTLNAEIAIFPNTEMITHKVINHTMLDTLRVCISFGIAYKERPQEAREVVLKTTEGDDRLHPSYVPQVVVREMSSSSVDMELRVFLTDPRQEVPVKLDYKERIFEALKAADIEIPFPHLQLFIDEAKAFEDAPFLQTGARGSTAEVRAEA
ncbi:MAG: mechanosensitive ion channel family protein [Bacteroidota bacterium]